jgi:hypothetical protein
MTAPAAPTIYVRQNGGMVRVAWREVDTATDYNVYLGPDSSPTGLEDSVNDAEGQANGWFVWYSGPEAGGTFVRVTALNALAEESAYSNQVYRYVDSEADTQQVPDDETHALQMQRKT